jgi:hypothetical protein
MMAHKFYDDTALPKLVSLALFIWRSLCKFSNILIGTLFSENKVVAFCWHWYCLLFIVVVSSLVMVLMFS